MITVAIFKETDMRNCEVCGELNDRPQSEYCSIKCANKAYYRKNRQKLINKASKWNRVNQDKRFEILQKQNDIGIQVWRTVQQRCESPTHKSFKDYGAKGVECRLSYEDFTEIYFRTDNCEHCGDKLNDGNRNRSDGRTIDRIKVGGHYEKKNVRVVCKKCNNGFKSKLSQKQKIKIRREYVYGSKTKGTVALARKYGVSQSTIHEVVNKS